MNKSDLTTVVANKLQNKLSKNEVAKIVNIFIETIKEVLENHEKVSLKGFLSFDTKLVQEKTGNSFGKNWTIASRYVPKVKFSTSFKKVLALSPQK